jgi:hypothetical protein
VVRHDFDVVLVRAHAHVRGALKRRINRGAVRHEDI